MNIHIRIFCPGDANAVNRIAVAAYAQYRDVFSDWPKSSVFFAESARLADELDLLIAEGNEKEILGFVGYAAPGRARDSIFEPGWAVIRRLAVDPIAQGRGIGRQLTKECIARGLNDGATFISLHTSPVMEAALSMYIRLGFSHHSDTAAVHGIPHAVYTLRLNA